MLDKCATNCHSSRPKARYDTARDSRTVGLIPLKIQQLERTAGHTRESAGMRTELHEISWGCVLGLVILVGGPSGKHFAHLMA
jgi:hypothetical protein